MYHLLGQRSQDSEYGWLYLLFIVGMIVFSTIAERIKKLMAEDKQQPRNVPKPRPPVPSSRRPSVSPAPKAEEHQTVQPMAPSRPRPVVRTEPVGRPAEHRGRAARKPVIERSSEESRPVIRGHSTPAPEAFRKVATATPEAFRAVGSSASASRGVTTPLTTSAAPDEIGARRVGMLTQPRLQQLADKASTRQAVSARSFRGLSAADLQRAVVLKEILEPPLAMRDA